MALTNGVITDGLYQSGVQTGPFESPAIRVSQYNSITVLPSNSCTISVYRLDSAGRRFALVSGVAGSAKIDIGPGLANAFAVGRRVVVSLDSGTASFNVEGTGANLGGPQAVTAESLLVVNNAEVDGNLDVEGNLNVDGDSSFGGKVGFNGVAPVGQAAAITPPAEQTNAYVQADVESLGTAIDAIIAVLKNAGLTA
jgi:hypothetical protein